jgi:hypothetical protein
MDFALPRADFQGAAYQFAIGLLQTDKPHLESRHEATRNPSHQL